MIEGDPLMLVDESQVHVSNKSTGVLTMAVGDAESILNLSRESIKRYAEKLDAEYVEILGPSLYSMWQHDKFRYHNYMLNYDRVLVIDCDVLIAHDCPDIFNLVPEDSLGIRNDILDVGDVSWWLEKERENVAASQHIEPRMLSTLYNTGVVVLSKQHYEVWRQPTYVLCQTHSCEQLWIEHQIYAFGHKVFELPPEYHCHAWTINFNCNAPRANIVHFSGVRNRIDEMTRFRNSNVRFN